MQGFWEVAKRSPFTTAECQAASPTDLGDSCEFGSNKYFAICGFGGIISCGLTHTLVTPLDLVKCRMQTNASKYSGVFKGFKVTLAEEGARGYAR